MLKNELPYWLQGLIIVGREEDEDKDDSEENSEEDQDDEESDDEDKDKGDEGTPSEREAALQEALEKERKLRRQAEREARKAKKTAATKKSTEEADDTKARLEQSETRTARLAKGFLDSKIEAAVLAEARKQGFIDPTDALINDVLKEVDADQDDEDPTDVEVDEESVVDAVKALARKKKHLVGQGTSTVKSGGKFRGKGGEDKGGSDAALQEHYPSLR